MASDRGLPAIPRGLDRGLTNYLRAMESALLRLSGQVRGSEESRAVRVADTATDVKAIVATADAVGAGMGERSVTGRALANLAVTTDKIADGAVISSKIANDAVTRNKIVNGAVNAAKLATGATLTMSISSTAANNGATVMLPGKWASQPLVALLRVLSLSNNRVGPNNVRLAQGGSDIWCFTAVGSFTWAAIGYRKG